MPSTFTPNLNLELQATGENAGTWGTILNTAALAVLDQVLGGVQTIPLSNVNVLVTTNQSQNNVFRLTGLLTANVVVTFPAVGRTIFVINQTTGNFTVTIGRTGGGTTVVIPQGRNGFLILDATGVVAETGNIPAGAVQAFAMSTVPAGWLECNGAAISRTTYAVLFSAIGTTYGAGDGATTFNLPDLRGYFVRGWDNGRGIDTGRVFGSAQATANLAHTHAAGTLIMPNHGHPYAVNRSDGNTTTTTGRFALRNSNMTTVPAYTGAPGSEYTQLIGGSGTLPITGATASDGATESRPVNLAMLYCIKF